MDHSYKTDYRSALSSLSERDLEGGLTLIAGSIILDSTHAKVSDSAIEKARIKIVDEAFAQSSGETIDSSDDWFFMAFLQPSDAIRTSLTLKTKLEAWAKSVGVAVKSPIGVHSVRVREFGISEEAADAGYSKDFEACHRLLKLCCAEEILVTQPAFDRARQSLSVPDLKSFGRLVWANHGPYHFPGLDLDCELGHIQADRLAVPTAPQASASARPNPKENDRSVWGWRPAAGVRLPRSRWILENKIRDGRFGEVWTVKDEGSSDKRMIECCFRSDIVESLKEQNEALLVVKRKLTENRNVLRLLEVALEKPPFHLMFEHFEGTDLRTWAKALGGAGSIPFSSRLELVAQIASGAQGIHEAKLLHNHLAPEHVLVFGTGQTLRDVQAKVTDLCTAHIRPEPAASPATSDHGAHGESSEERGPDQSKMYAAPEVVEGNSPTVKSDVYSVGVILCQFLLGNLSEPLGLERLGEILAGLKREGMIPACAEDPAERIDRPGKIAQELRTMIRERESRVSESGTLSRRHMIEAVASLILAVVALSVIVIFGPKYLKRKKKAEPEKTPEEEEPTGNKVVYGRRSRTPKPEDRDSPGVITFKFLVLPLCVVIIIGTFVRQFGHRIYLWYRAHRYPSPPEE